MSLSTEQALFTRDLVKLLQFCWDKGIEVTFGEVLRTPEQQAIYLKTGRSKTSNSQHLKRLAADLNFFVNGKLVQDREALRAVWQYWESLDPKNRAGANWRGLVDAGKSSFVDLPHFERMG